MRSARRHIVRKRVFLGLLLAVWLTPAWGATLSLLSLNDLISKSTTIVQAQVTGSSASYTGSVIYTHYKVNVLAQWKGPAQTAIDVMVPGGKAKGMRQICPGVPQLAVGQQYVLFLWTSRFGLTYTMGFTQGVFNLQDRQAIRPYCRCPPPRPCWRGRPDKPFKTGPSACRCRS